MELFRYLSTFVLVGFMCLAGYEGLYHLLLPERVKAKHLEYLAQHPFMARLSPEMWLAGRIGYASVIRFIGICYLLAFVSAVYFILLWIRT